MVQKQQPHDVPNPSEHQVNKAPNPTSEIQSEKGPCDKPTLPASIRTEHSSNDNTVQVDKSSRGGLPQVAKQSEGQEASGKHVASSLDESMQDLNQSGRRQPASQDDDDSDNDCFIISETKAKKPSGSTSSSSSSSSSSGDNEAFDRRFPEKTRKPCESKSSSSSSDGDKDISARNPSEKASSSALSRPVASQSGSTSTVTKPTSDGTTSSSVNPAAAATKKLYLINGKVVSSDVELSAAALQELAKKLQFPPYVSNQATDVASTQMSRLKISEKYPTKPSSASAQAQPHTTETATLAKSASASDCSTSSSAVVAKVQEARPSVKQVSSSQAPATLSQVLPSLNDVSSHQGDATKPPAEQPTGASSSQAFLRPSVQGPTSFGMIKPPSSQVQQGQSYQQVQQQHHGLPSASHMQSMYDLQQKVRLESQLRKQQVSFIKKLNITYIRKLYPTPKINCDVTSGRLCILRRVTINLCVLPLYHIYG